MALSHTTKVFGIADAKLSVLTADPATGSPTYAASIDVPGAKGCEVKLSFTLKELRGDNTRIDVQPVLDKVSGTLTYGKSQLDVVAAMLGLTVVDAGTTPNQTATLDITQSTKPAYFKVQGLAAGVDLGIGSGNLAVWKCVVSGDLSIGLAEEDYETYSIPFDAVPLICNGKIASFVENETAAVLT